MSSLAFPTRPGPNRPGRLMGRPDRAIPCACGSRRFAPEPRDTCVRCGHYAAGTIEFTFKNRARQIANAHQSAQLAA